MVQGFDFQLTPHIDRRVRKLGLCHCNYTAHLVQCGGGCTAFPVSTPQQILPHQTKEVLQRAITSQVLTDEEVGHQHQLEQSQARVSLCQTQSKGFDGEHPTCLYCVGTIE